MEGFIHLKVSPWLRRLITRGLAIIPTIIVVWLNGERGTEKLLILSQVILGIQLPFAVLPLVWFTTRRSCLGEHAFTWPISSMLWTTAILTLGFNAWMVAHWLS